MVHRKGPSEHLPCFYSKIYAPNFTSRLPFPTIFKDTPSRTLQGLQAPNVPPLPETKPSESELQLPSAKRSSWARLRRHIQFDRPIGKSINAANGRSRKEGDSSLSIQTRLGIGSPVDKNCDPWKGIGWEHPHCALSIAHGF